MPGKEPERDLVELVMFCSLIRVLVIQVCSVCDHLFSGILAVYALPIYILYFSLLLRGCSMYKGVERSPRYTVKWEMQESEQNVAYAIIGVKNICGHIIVYE